MKPIAVLKGVSKYYGRIRALHSITLSIPRGLHVLVGPNGSGKTTLLKIMAGMLKPSSGEVKVLGRDPFRDSWIKGRISYLPEKLYLPPLLRVGDALRIFLELPGWSRERADALKKALRIDFEDKLVGELSEGMRQKLSLLIFLSRDPLLVLADEPTANLDPPSRLRAMMEFRKMADRGASVIIATHSIYEPALFADSIIALIDGRVKGVVPASSLVDRDVRIRVRGSFPSSLVKEGWLLKLGEELYELHAPSMREALRRLGELASAGRILAVDPLLPKLEEVFGGAG